ncbi:MAG: NUDIX domain-containing protein [Campylobacteraceae bacterium]|jgi:UDP-sugar diphosphatase|nr:NUDIX domain-containing protein [Campylobacteraceae bacterium]
MNSKTTKQEIKIVKIKSNVSSQYIQPFRVFYIQNDKEKKWDFVKTHDSVACLLYHTQKDAFLLVKQFRPPVYLHGKCDGFTYEMCAGILDKNKSLEQTMKEEILEECGYDVALENIEKITSFYTGVGFAGSRQMLYFTVIDESMKMQEGGGVEGEEIELFFLSRSEVRNFMYDENKAKTPGVLFAIFWFFENKLDLFKKITSPL